MCTNATWRSDKDFTFDEMLVRVCWRCDGVLDVLWLRAATTPSTRVAYTTDGSVTRLTSNNFFYRIWNVAYEDFYIQTWPFPWL